MPVLCKRGARDACVFDCSDVCIFDCQKKTPLPRSELPSLTASMPAIIALPPAWPSRPTPTTAPLPPNTVLPHQLPHCPTTMTAFTKKHYSTQSTCKRGTKNAPLGPKPRHVYNILAPHGPTSVNAASPGRDGDGDGDGTRLGRERGRDGRWGRRRRRRRRRNQAGTGTRTGWATGMETEPGWDGNEGGTGTRPGPRTAGGGRGRPGG